MKKISKFFLTFLLIFTLTAGSSVCVFAEEETSAEETSGEETATEEDSADETSSDFWPEGPELYSGSALVIDTTTGATLYSVNDEERIYPASTTKILTCLLVLENCSLDEIVTFSATAVDLPSDASTIDAVEGEQMTVEECLYGLMLPSGNDCANALAEHVAGSIEAFVEMMNERAEELGCTASHFTNTNGLDDTDHYTTAQDMYLIAKEAFSNSTFVEIVSCSSYTIDATNMSDARTYTNTNYLIQGDSEYYNSTVVGGKTGYTSIAGRALVVLSKSNNMNLICIFFNCPIYTGVFSDANEVLDYVYNNFSIINISESEERFSSSFSNAKVVLDSTASILIPSTLSLSDLDSEISFATDMDSAEFEQAKLDAGITTQDGRHLYASISYYYDGNYLGNIYVLLDDELEIASSSVSGVIYINSAYAYLTAVLAIVVMAALIMIAGTRRKKFTRR